MPTATVTTEVMRALPAALRPNPHVIDEEVMALCAKGWTPTQIAGHCVKQGDKEPSHVVSTIRLLKDYPLPGDHKPTTTNSTHTAHAPCTQHGAPCQLCYCHKELPEPVHHVSTPMPQWFRTALQQGGTQAAFDKALQGVGIYPPHPRQLLDTHQLAKAHEYIATALAATNA